MGTTTLNAVETIRQLGVYRYLILSVFFFQRKKIYDYDQKTSGEVRHKQERDMYSAEDVSTKFGCTKFCISFRIWGQGAPQPFNAI